MFYHAMTTKSSGAEVRCRSAICLRTEIRGSGYVVATLEAVVWSLITTDSFREALLKAVNLGEDTDTVGAIAGGLAALYYGYEAIPPEWIAELKRKEWIEELCEKAGRIS